MNNNIALDNIDTTIKDIDVCRNICYPFKLNVEEGKNKKDSFYKGKKELIVLTSQETKLTQRNSGNNYSLNACISINEGSQNSNGNYFRVGCDKGVLSVPFFVSTTSNCKTATLEIVIEVYKKFYKLIEPKLKVLVDAGTPEEHIEYFPISLTETETTMMYIYEGIIPSYWDQDNDKIEALECGIDFISRTSANFQYSTIYTYDKNNTSNDRYDQYTNVKGYRVSASLTDLYIENANVPRDEMNAEGYYVDGEMYLDDDYGFQNTDVLVSPGGKIIVDDISSSKRINNVVIHGCSHMWKGIEVKPGTHLFIDMYDSNGNPGICEIRDAEIGINSLSKSSVFLDGIVLHNNVIHITSDDSYSYIAGSGLTSEETNWLPYYSGQQLVKIGTYTNIGIKLSNNASAELTYSGLRKAHTGIYAESNAGIYLQGAEIETIPRLQNQGSIDYTGVAVYSTGTGSRAIYGFADNSIYNCDIGIKSIRNQVEFMNSNIYQCRKGIEITNSNRSHFIYQNTITANQIGIEIVGNYNQNFRIEDNTITIDPPLGSNFKLDLAGIKLADCQSKSCEIKYNQIWVNGLAKHGILLKNNSGGLIDHNDIYLIGSNKKGIDLTPQSFSTSGVFNRIFCNDVVGTLLSDQISYHSTLTGPYLRCNTSQFADKGFFFSLPCMGSLFFGNNMDGGVGLYIDNGSIIGVKSHQGNCWDLPDAYNPSNAFNANTNVPLIMASQFIVDPIERTCFLPSWSANGQGDWFVPLANAGNAPTCPGQCGSSSQELPPLVCDFGQFELILDSVFMGEDFGEALQWQAEAQSYAILNSFDSCGNWHSNIVDFYNLKTPSEIGQLYRVEERFTNQGLEAIFTPLTALEGLSNQIDSLSAQISTLLEEGNADSLITLLQNQIDTLQMEANDIASTIDSILIAGVDSTIILNELVVPSTISGARLKAINEVYLQYFRDHDKEIIVENILVLDSIANLCIKEGGYATLRARFLIDLVREEPEYDDDISCNLPEPLILSNKTVKSDERFIIYPNPSSGVFCVKNAEQTEISNVIVLDMHGRVYNSLFDHHNLEVNVSLLPGCYFVKLLFGDGSVSTKKLIINK
ncbi:MAG: T9SS type A sorting domain-containing protein [Saprospiraceae bacterium]|nr:T9SS type A sorting domain-containing protein [Saprospiraceae bacterium]